MKDEPPKLKNKKALRLLYDLVDCYERDRAADFIINLQDIVEETRQLFDKLEISNRP